MQQITINYFFFFEKKRLDFDSFEFSYKCHNRKRKCELMRIRGVEIFKSNTRRASTKSAWPIIIFSMMHWTGTMVWENEIACQTFGDRIHIRTDILNINQREEAINYDKNSAKTFFVGLWKLFSFFFSFFPYNLFCIFVSLEIYSFCQHINVKSVKHHRINIVEFLDWIDYNENKCIALKLKNETKESENKSEREMNHFGKCINWSIFLFVARLIQFFSLV